MELKTTFQAGAAKIDITPPLGTIINGDFKAHYAKTIHDPLFAKAVVISDNDVMIALVVVDICVMPKIFVDQVRQTITDQLGINFSNILISSTHTHAAGSVAEAYLSAVDSGYSRKLPGLILEAVRLAKSRLTPSKIGFGKVNVPAHVRSRRYFMDNGYEPINPITGTKELVKTNPFGAENYIQNPATPTDPELSYLAIQQLSGEWVTVIANYSLHYVGDWENGTISADYFGEFAAELKASLQADDDFIGIMSNGTSGDINIWEFVKQNNYPSAYFEKSKLIGKDLATQVSRSMEQLQWEENPKLAVEYQELPISCRKPSSDELENAKKVVATSDYENLEVNDEGLKRIYAREQLLLNEYPATINFPVQAIKIGNGVIGGLAGEIFASTGLWLKANGKRAHYFTISMANGNCGYVPPPEEFEKGGYETWRSRTSYLEKNAATLLQNKLLQLIQKLTT